MARTPIGMDRLAPRAGVLPTLIDAFEPIAQSPRSGIDRLSAVYAMRICCAATGNCSNAPGETGRPSTSTSTARTRTGGGNGLWCKRSGSLQPVEGMGHPARECLRRPSQDFGEAKQIGATRQTGFYKHCKRSTWVHALQSRAWQGHLRVMPPTTEQAAPSESPPPSRRQSPSSWTSALREALPSATRRSTSLQPQGSPNWQWAGRSAHEGFGGWQEYQGDYHRLVPDWHGALSCASLAAPFDTCSPPAEREQILGVTGFWLQRRDPPSNWIVKRFHAAFQSRISCGRVATVRARRPAAADTSAIPECLAQCSRLAVSAASAEA